MPSLPPQLKSLVLAPTGGGRLAKPRQPPKAALLTKLFQDVSGSATSNGLGWGEWLSITTAVLFTLDSPGSLQALQRFAAPSSFAIEERVARTALLREVGLKTIGFAGIPKVINNLAAVRKAVEEDAELVAKLPSEARRQVTKDNIDLVHKSAYGLWDNIYTPLSNRLIDVLRNSHPDLPGFIIENEYGPLFASPGTFHDPAQPEPSWEVNRLRTSLVAIAALRAQGGVGPQVTSHIWGLLKAKESIAAADVNKKGLEWLTSEEGAEWVVRTVDQIAEVIEGTAEADREPKPAPKPKL